MRESCKPIKAGGVRVVKNNRSFGVRIVADSVGRLEGRTNGTDRRVLDGHRSKCGSEHNKPGGLAASAHLYNKRDNTVSGGPRSDRGALNVVATPTASAIMNHKSEQ